MNATSAEQRFSQCNYELRSVFSFPFLKPTKQHAKKKRRKKSLPIKQFTGKSPVNCLGRNPGEIQRKRRLAQFSGHRGNSVISFHNRSRYLFLRPLLSLFLPTANNFSVPLTEVAFLRALTVWSSLRLSTATSKRTAPGQLLRPFHGIRCQTEFLKKIIYRYKICIMQI